jgi:hypothetical protein
MEHIPEIQDLVVEECIPSCETCPCIWTNKNINHRIVCNCKKCEHGISVREYHKDLSTSGGQKVSDKSVTMTGVEGDS